MAAEYLSSPSGSSRSQPGRHAAMTTGSVRRFHTASGGAANVYDPLTSMSGRLFELGDDRAQLTVDERLGVDAIARIEPGVAGRPLVDDALAVGRRRLQRTVSEVDHDDVLVVEMHRRRLSGRPCVVPHDDAAILVHLLIVGTGKRIRKT